MAKICSPSGVNSEGKITFDEYRLSQITNPDLNKLLLGGQLPTENYNNGVFLDIGCGADYITFTIPAKSNIWAITNLYQDNGGATDQPVNLYKLEADEYVLIGKFATAAGGYNVWYKLFSELMPGKYKVEATGTYTAWQGWYVENASRMLYLSDNTKVYGMDNCIFAKVTDLVRHAETKAHFALWQPNTTYQQQDVVRTSACPSWGFYMCAVAGTSGEEEPVGSVEGDIVEDGSCTWVLSLLGGATTIGHEVLTNRNLPDQHEIAAITDLAATIAQTGKTAEDNAKDYADQKINALVGDTPEAIETLKELAKYLQEHGDAAGTITASLANKVDKVKGKGLSSNDYTAIDKTKMDHLTVTKSVNLDTLGAKSHEHLNKALLDTYRQTETSLADAVKKKHEHANAAVLEQITAKNGQLHYDDVQLAAKKDAIKYALIL